MSPDQRTAFNAAWPNRFAVKHAHSQQNSEKDWGRYTLAVGGVRLLRAERALRQALARRRARLRTLNPSNTIVIASSVSNGAGAALAAAELDTQGLISGVAVGEPQIQLVPDARLSVRRGNSVLAGTGKPLYDYTTLANLLQPCAALASPATNVFNTINPVIAANRCAVLKANGLVIGNTTAEQAGSAMATLVQAQAGSPRATICRPRTIPSPPCRWR